MIKICLCPTSILWITRHIKKSAKAQWKLMISRNKPTRRKSRKSVPKKRRKSSKPKRLKSVTKGIRTTKKRKLKAGIHLVKVGGRIRRVKVLKNGQWRFMKRFG